MNRLILAITCLQLIVSCAPVANRTNMASQQKLKSIKTFVVVTPEVDIFELNAGGLTEKRDDWSLTGQQNVRLHLEDALKSANLQVVWADLKSDSTFVPNFALYKSVSHTINMHVMGNGAYAFPTKSKKFDYSIGSVNSILERYQADGIVFVYGFDQVSSSGRQALGALGILAGALTGVAVVPRGGVTFLSMAVVDRDGYVAWYGRRVSEGSADLRKAGDAKNWTKSLVKDLSKFQ